MALAALICAYRDTHGGDGSLRATLPLAGRTLLERQVRQAARAGAVRIVVLVERMPPPLTAALDRLRNDGLPVSAARNADEAGQAVDGNDRLLLIADGYVGPQDSYDRISAGESATISFVPDNGDERFERIDSESRWAGLATTTGVALRETAAMLRDWDLQSTLLRRIVQANAARIEGAEGTIVETQADLATAESKLLTAAGGGRHMGIATRLTGPLERLLLPWVAPRPIPASALLLGAPALTIGAALLAGLGFLLSALVLLLLAQPAEGLAGRLASLRLDTESGRSWAAHVLPSAAGAALLALGYTLSLTFGWGALLMAAVTLAFLFALRVEAAGVVPPYADLLASRDLLPWLLLPFAFFGQWLAGLAVLFAFAALSFFWAQYHAHQPGAGQA